MKSPGTVSTPIPGLQLLPAAASALLPAGRGTKLLQASKLKDVDHLLQNHL